MSNSQVNYGRRKEDRIARDKYLKLNKAFTAFLIIAFLVSAATAIHFYYAYETALEVIEDISEQYAADIAEKPKLRKR